MALEITCNAANPSLKKDIQYPVYKLFIEQTLSGIADQTLQGVIDAFKAKNELVIVNVTRERGQEVENLVSNMPLNVLLEAAAQGEGYIQIKESDVDGTFVLKGSVELSNVGALDVSDSELLVIDFANAGAATLTTKVSTYQSLVLTDTSLQYEPKTILPDSKQTIDLKDTYCLLLPPTCTEVILKTGSRSQKIKGDEFEQIAIDSNDVTYNVDGKIKAVNDFFLLPVSNVDSVEITLSVQGKIYKLINNSPTQK